METSRQLDKIDRMCRNAVGRKMNIRSRKTGALKKGWVVIAAEFVGWRNRGRSEIAQFRVTLENPPNYPNRVQEKMIVESFKTLHD